MDGNTKGTQIVLLIFSDDEAIPVVPATGLQTVTGTHLIQKPLNCALAGETDRYRVRYPISIPRLPR